MGDFISSKNDLDINHLNKLTDNDLEINIELIKTYINETEKIIKSLITNIQNENTDEIRKLIHKVKPSTQYLKLNKLVIQLESIKDEKISISEKISGLGNIWQETKILLNNLLKELTS